VCGDLRRHPARHRRHRRQQRQAARFRRDRFIRDGDGAAGDQVLRLPGVGGKVQKGEQHLSRLELPALDWLRFLHLDDEFGLRVYLTRGVGDACACGPVLGVPRADSGAGIVFDQYAVAARDQLPHRLRDQPDAVFMGLDFLRHSDAHRLPRACVR
jgi:hypothetical protein